MQKAENKRTEEFPVEYSSTMSRLGLEKVEQALLVLPAYYVDLRCANTRIGTLPLDGLPRLYAGTVVEKIGYDSEGIPTQALRPTRLDILFAFEDGQATLSIFGATFVWHDLEPGTRLTFISTLREFQGRRVLSGLSPHAATGRARAFYRGVSGQVSGEAITSFVRSVLKSSLLRGKAASIVEDRTSVWRDLLSMHYRTPLHFLTSLHAPESPEVGRHALKLARSACVLDIRSQALIGKQNADQCHRINIDAALIDCVAAQPEKLTQGQRQALNKIRLAMKQGALRVLLNGDVGSGKTLVFLLAAAAICDARTHASGVAVILEPSDLVARQVHAQAVKRFPHLHPALVCAGKNTVETDTKVIVGTHALFSQSVSDVALLIIDEQHKFSREQREKLVGSQTHVIEASATPLPRSLALGVFGGWTQAVIAGQPVVKSISNHILLHSQRTLVVRRVRAALQNGQRVIFLYSRTSAGDASCEQAFTRLSDHFQNQVCIMHGKKSSSHNSAALETFRSGATPVLVASTVIEVGVDIADIGVLVVHDADRLGAAQLHQLRGRLVRNGGSGDFFMLTATPPKDETRKRLDVDSG